MFIGAGGGSGLLAAENVQLDEYGANVGKVTGLLCGNSCCVKIRDCCKVAACEDGKATFEKSTNAGGT